MQIGINGNWNLALLEPEALTYLGVQWCKFGHELVDTPEGIAEQCGNTDQVLDALLALGIEPVIDLRTDATFVREEAMRTRATRVGEVPGEELGRTMFEGVYVAVADFVRETVARYSDRCTNWEWWGEPYCPHVTQNMFTAFDYGLSLAAAYDAAKEADPDCRVWSGGFGVNADFRFIRDVASAHCPDCGTKADPDHDTCPQCNAAMDAGAGKKFDICNLHHYAHGRSLESVVAFYDKQLTDLREMLDGPRCMGQPFASTEWGLPTVPIAKGDIPPWLSSLVLSQGVQAVCEGDAAEWYDAMLGLFYLHGFETVCIHTLDDNLPSAKQHWADYCGLRTRFPLGSGAMLDEPRWKLHAETVREWAEKGRS